MMKPIKIPTSKDYARNEKRCRGNDIPCIVCGKPIKDPIMNVTGTILWLRAGSGSLSTAIDPNSPDQGGGEMGCWPIGSDCLRRNPQLKPYTFLNGEERG